MGKNDVFQNQERKRGRPAGKNRVPLSAEERRARNAQYERERRTETAEAMTQLAEALGCDNTLSNADILAIAVQQLQTASNRDQSEDIFELRRCNTKLIKQIEDIEARLSTWEDRVDVRPKTNGGIKKKDKNIKKKKIAKQIRVPKEILTPPTPTETPSTNEPTLNEASTSDDQIIKPEPVQLTELEPFQFENVSEYPVTDWGIDELITEYLSTPYLDP